MRWLSGRLACSRAPQSTPQATADRLVGRRARRPTSRAGSGWEFSWRFSYSPLLRTHLSGPASRSSTHSSAWPHRLLLNLLTIVTLAQCSKVQVPPRAAPFCPVRAAYEVPFSRFICCLNHRARMAPVLHSPQADSKAIMFRERLTILRHVRMGPATQTASICPLTCRHGSSGRCGTRSLRRALS